MKQQFSILTPPIIQVAGICDLAEAEMLINCGIEYLGFPLRLPVNKEDIEEQDAANIIKNLPAQYYGVIITYLDQAQEVVHFCQKMNSNIVQLHNDIDIKQLARIRQLAPHLKIIKSLVFGKYNLEQLKNMATEITPFVDCFITDTFDPKTGASGATGLTHEWNHSKELVEFSDKPVILAGGLTPENVGEAISKVKPAGVDVHTGVEDRHGRKSKEKILKFISEAQSAFQKI